MLKKKKKMVTGTFLFQIIMKERPSRGYRWSSLGQMVQPLLLPVKVSWPLTPQEEAVGSFEYTSRIDWCYEGPPPTYFFNCYSYIIYKNVLCYFF
jgi:hypothetical protein